MFLLLTKLSTGAKILVNMHQIKYISQETIDYGPDPLPDHNLQVSPGMPNYLTEGAIIGMTNPAYNLAVKESVFEIFNYLTNIEYAPPVIT